MADYYNLYKRTIISEVTKRITSIYPGQLLSFNYGNSKSRVVFSIGVWNKKLHCLKLNEVNPNELAKHFRLVISDSIVDRYEKAIAYGVYDEALRMNEYQLPLKMPTLGMDQTAQYFYKNVVRPSGLLSGGNVYRTYNMGGIKALRILVPDLQKLGFLGSTIRRELLTDIEKANFLRTGREWDDYSKRQKFGKQDEQFD